MRPIRLELEGFGAFSSRQVVQFDRLDRVFLISGDTGAGKTTLFDAISYALYDKPLGTREGQPVRSTLVSDTVSTCVRFRFACAGRTWEVLRSPHWVRKAERGGGVVTEKLLTLHEIGADGTATPVSGKPAELNRRLEEDIVQLRHEEFAKILVLPQGEFQRFLEMPSDKRGDILEKLFPTVEHRRLTEHARVAVAELRRRVEDLEARQREVLREFDPARYPEHKADLLERVEHAKARERETARHARQAAEKRTAAQVLAQALQKRDQTLAEQRAHEQQRARVTQAQAELEHSRRAARAVGAVRAEETLRTQVRQATEVGEQQREEARQGTQRLADLQPGYDALPAREAALLERRQERDRLAGRREDLEQLRAALAQVRELQGRAEGAEREVQLRARQGEEAQEQVARLAQVQVRRDALAVGLQAARDRVAGLAALQGDADKARTWTETQLPALTRQHAEQQDRLEALRQETVRAQARWTEARQRLESQAAALLAATLVAGEACPVCGSPEHPTPAQGTADDADVRSWVQAAESNVASAQAAESAQAAVLAGVATEIDLRREAAEEAANRLRAAGFTGADAYRQAREQAGNAAAQLETEDADLAGQLRTRKAREDAAQSARERKERAEVAHADARARLEAARAVRQTVAARVGDVADVAVALQEAVTIQAEVERTIEQEQHAIETMRAEWNRAVAQAKAAEAVVQSGAEALAVLRNRLALAEQELRQALQDHGFADVLAVQSAWRAAEEEGRLQRGIEAWTQKDHQLAADLATLEATIAGRTMPDLGEHQREAEQAEVASGQAIEARAGTEAAVVELEGRHGRYEEIRGQLETLQRESRGLLQLAKDLTGDNPKRLDFPTYVLTWWLEQVLRRASARLRVLSDERYTFALRAEVADRRRRGGLDLDIRDAHTAGCRDVRTLSGGEKFLASISLALGLADVIQERAGGIELDTLFIDEGFGSLDATTMDRAMEVIDEIGDHRRVGVISHVEGVKKAIPCHVIVEKGAEGSRVRVG